MCYVAFFFTTTAVLAAVVLLYIADSTCTDERSRRPEPSGPTSPTQTVGYITQNGGGRYYYSIRPFEMHVKAPQCIRKYTYIYCYIIKCRTTFVPVRLLPVVLPTSRNKYVRHPRAATIVGGPDSSSLRCVKKLD